MSHVVGRCTLARRSPAHKLRVGEAGEEGLRSGVAGARERLGRGQEQVSEISGRYDVISVLISQPYAYYAQLLFPVREHEIAGSRVA